MRDTESFIEPVEKRSGEKGQPEQYFHRELSHFISSKRGKKWRSQKRGVNETIKQDKWG